jgi:Ni,Fe-hydrogenase I large subunit
MQENELKKSKIKQKMSRKFKDTKVVMIRSHKSMDRQCNGKKKKDKRTNNDLQTLHRKQTKDQATRTSLRHWMNSSAPEGLTVPVLHLTPVLLLL